jgi:ELWxxDGT repeat protein
LGSRAIFAATDPAHGRELWITDGTAAGSSLLSDLNGATGNATPGAPVGSTVISCSRRLIMAASP